MQYSSEIQQYKGTFWAREGVVGTSSQIHPFSQKYPQIAIGHRPKVPTPMDVPMTLIRTQFIHKYPNIFKTASCIISHFIA